MKQITIPLAGSLVGAMLTLFALGPVEAEAAFGTTEDIIQATAACVNPVENFTSIATGDHYRAQEQFTISNGFITSRRDGEFLRCNMPNNNRVQHLNATALRVWMDVPAGSSEHWIKACVVEWDASEIDCQGSTDLGSSASNQNWTVANISAWTNSAHEYWSPYVGFKLNQSDSVMRFKIDT